MSFTEHIHYTPNSAIHPTKKWTGTLTIPSFKNSPGTILKLRVTKGVTGIIYPCTRTRKINGKNLVLFNPNDAVPIDNSIREIEF